VRLSRVRQLMEAGDPRARIVLDLLGHLDRVVSGVQVGITLTSLGLGALVRLRLPAAEPAGCKFSGRHTAVVVHAISLAVAFLLLTILHVVLGELVPKSLSLQRAGPVALLVARPFQWYLGIFRTGDRSTRWNQPMDPERIGAIPPPEPHTRAFRRRIADSDPAGARTRLDRRGRRKIDPRRDRA